MSIYGQGALLAKKNMTAAMNVRPFWISIWTYMSSLDGSLFGVYLSGSSSTVLPWMDSSAGGQFYDNGSWVPSATSGNVQGSWAHWFVNCGVGTNQRQVYRNGVLYAQDSSGGGTYTIMYLGGWTGSRMTTANSALAELSAGPGMLTLNQIQALAAGRNPLNLRSPNQLHFYHPLRNDYSDAGPSQTPFMVMSTNKPVWGPHPNVDQLPNPAIGIGTGPRRRLMSVPALVIVSGNNPLSGVIDDGGLSTVGALTQANPLSGVVTEGALGEVGTLSQANPLTGVVNDGGLSAQGSLSQVNAALATVDWGAFSEVGQLTQVNTLSGVIDDGAEVTSGTIGAQGNPLQGTIDNGGMTMQGNLLEADTVSGTLDYGALSEVGYFALALTGTMDYGQPDMTGVLAQTNALTGTIDESEVTSGELTQANPADGTVSYVSDEWLAALTQANTVGGSIDFAATDEFGSLLESDQIAGTISYDYSVKGQIVGAAYVIEDYSGFSYFGSLTQANAVGGVVDYDITSTGTLTQQDVISGGWTVAADEAQGTLTQSNAISGVETIIPGLGGILLSINYAGGLVEYDSDFLTGTIDQEDFIDGTLSFTMGWSGQIGAILRQAPALSTLPTGQIATVQFDSRMSLPVPFDDRMAH